MILDNQGDRVLLDTDIRHYRPIYSINESAWWLHAEPSQKCWWRNLINRFLTKK